MLDFFILQKVYDLILPITNPLGYWNLDIKVV